MRVLLDEIGRCSLEVFATVLRLTKPHQMFTVMGLERRLQLEAA